MLLRHRRHDGHRYQCKEHVGCSGEVRGYQEQYLGKEVFQQDIAELIQCSLTINVAEPTSLALFGMMKSSCPIDCDITFTTIETCGTLHTTPCADTTELKEAIKDWTVISHIETTLLLLIRLHIVRRHFIQEVNVLVGMELRHFKLGSRLRTLLIVSQQRSSISVMSEERFPPRMMSGVRSVKTRLDSWQRGRSLEWFKWIRCYNK